MLFFASFAALAALRGTGFLVPAGSRKSVILSEAKNLHWFTSDRDCRSFASLRMTANFLAIAGPRSHGRLQQLAPIRSFFALFASKNQFVLSSFLRVAQCNVLCLQQIHQFVPTIFSIFRRPLLPAALTCAVIPARKMWCGRDSRATSVRSRLIFTPSAGPPSP